MKFPLEVSRDSTTSGERASAGREGKWRGLLQCDVMLRLTGIFTTRSADLQVALRGGDPSAFPFKSELSLAPLLRFWEKKFGDDTSSKGVFVRTVREQVTQVPELL